MIRIIPWAHRDVIGSVMRLYKKYGSILVRIELKKNLCFRCMSNHFILQLKDELSGVFFFFFLYICQQGNVMLLDCVYLDILSAENQKAVNAVHRCFRWETEGRYRHRLCTAIVHCWFSTEHRTMIIPFWLSTDYLNLFLSLLPIFSNQLLKCIQKNSFPVTLCKLKTM